MKLTSAVRTAQSVITANSPILLVGTTIAGIVTTGVLAARGGYKARGIVDAAQAERDSQPTSAPLTTTEKFQLTWLCYVAPAATGASAVASVVGLHVIHNKRQAALAALYAVTASRLDDYREEAEKLLGSKKAQQLNDTMGQKAIDANPIDSAEVIITGAGTELMYDDASGRYWDGSVSQVEIAVAKINGLLNSSGDATLNDFYDAIGLPNVPLSENLGWSGELIEAKYGGVKTKDDRSAVSVWFHPEPKNALRPAK